MSAEESKPVDQATLVMNTIIIETYMDSDGEMHQQTSVSNGITVMEALGMLRYAEHQVIAAPTGGAPTGAD